MCTNFFKVSEADYLRSTPHRRLLFSFRVPTAAHPPPPASLLPKFLPLVIPVPLPLHCRQLLFTRVPPLCPLAPTVAHPCAHSSPPLRRCQLLSLPKFPQLVTLVPLPLRRRQLLSRTQVPPAAHTVSTKHI